MATFRGEHQSFMKRIIISLLATSMSSISLSEEQRSGSANIFNLNGRNISVSDSFLLELREYWKGNTGVIVTSSLLKEADVRWSLDYISLMEVVNSKECKSLEVMQTRKFDPTSDTDNTGAKIESGAFDYVWEVKVCDIQRSYRLVNQKGSPSFTLYPLNL